MLWFEPPPMVGVVSLPRTTRGPLGGGGYPETLLDPMLDPPSLYVRL